MIVAAIARSSSAKSYHSILIAHLSSPSATTRLLANMVLVDLMARLDGSAATQLGVGILASIDKALQSASLRSVEAAEDPISPRYHQAVYAKPDDPQTARRATLSLLASFCNLSTTPVERINWFDESDYRTLTFKLYRHANSDALPPVLARRLLQRLFTVLREEALTFFASVWTAAEVATPLKVAALRHASAFVKSYTLGTDFQMVMPSILVACTASSEAVREAAVALLKVVNRSASNETKNYYALDTFYGPRSGGSESRYRGSRTTDSSRQGPAAEAWGFGPVPTGLNPFFGRHFGRCEQAGRRADHSSFDEPRSWQERDRVSRPTADRVSIY